jgi:hypothetical protein
VQTGNLAAPHRQSQEKRVHYRRWQFAARLIERESLATFGERLVDIRESVGKVTDAGGKMLGEPIEIPGVGQYVSFTDTEGNRVSMLQPISRNWHAPKSE